MQAPLHVLLITSFYPSRESPAFAVFCKEQARALATAGHRVGVLVLPRPRFSLLPDRAPGPAGELLLAAEDEGPAVLRCPGSVPYDWPRTASLVARRRGLHAYARYCRKHGTPDVLHAHFSLYGGDVAVALKEHHGIPVLLTEHHSAFLTGAIRRGQAPFVRRALAGSDKILAVSPQLARAVAPWASGREVEVLGNSVDPGFFTPGEGPPADAPFTVSTVANLRPAKAVDLLIEAFALAFRGDRAALCIGGDGGGERAALERLAAARGLAAQVHFLGTLTRAQVRDLFRRSHVVACSSRVETFGITLIEAMACGRPVVATRSGGPEWLVEEGCGGALVPADDPAALAAALRQVREQTAAARFNPQRIRDGCLRRFAEPVVLGRLATIYRELAAARPRSR